MNEPAVEETEKFAQFYAEEHPWLGGIEIRGKDSGAMVVGVDFPKRTVELIVMPYEVAAAVSHKGRMITEIISRGAFDGVERRTKRISVNRDHDVQRTIGKVLALHPSRQEGLVASVKISRTQLGNESLALADDGILDASAGFGIMDKPGAEVWESHRPPRRRLNHLWLDHVALTPDPAYEGAKVLAVRANEPTERRPNIDQLELDTLQRLYADLDARYGVTQH